VEVQRGGFRYVLDAMCGMCEVLDVWLKTCLCMPKWKVCPPGPAREL